MKTKKNFIVTFTSDNEEIKKDCIKLMQVYSVKTIPKLLRKLIEFEKLRFNIK